MPRAEDQRFYSATCSQQARRTRVTKSCDACSQTYETTNRDSRYCSRECHHLALIEQAGNTGCKVEGCGKPHRARGLCTTHYNHQYQPNRHRKVTVACSVCGTLVVKSPRSGRSPVCSEACRYVVEWGETKANKDARREAERRSHMQLVGPVRPSKTTQAPTQVIASSRRKYSSTQCRDCGEWFIDYSEGRHRRPSVTCSETCARRWSSRRRRKFWIPTTVRLSIYRRDNWTCQLCHQPVEKQYDQGDMWSASLDHIVPQAHGGTDEPENLRLTHRYCNAIRSDAKLADDWFISPGA